MTHAPADNTVDVDDGGRFWRVVDTDTERPTGVAPVCAQQGDVDGLHWNREFEGLDPRGVYDCCPGPHLETWDEGFASDLADDLNRYNVRLCT